MGTCLSRSRTKGQDSTSYLYSSEVRWAELQPFLLARGYVLRSRYQPNWQPSWKQRGSKVKRHHATDSIPLERALIIDAVRIADGKKVAIKMVRTHTNELPIIQFLNSPRLRADKRNRMVEVMDMLLLPDTDEYALVVMPRLIPFAVIPFQFVGEVCDALLAFLEGLSFFHEQGIAHRDACLLNLMMNGEHITGNNSHFGQITHTEDDITKPIQYKARRDVEPMTYSYIDVGISKWYPPGADSRDRAISGLWGQDKTLPEFRRDFTGPVDPFQTDVCQLGSVFARIARQYEGLSVLEPLTVQMTLPQPELRPTSQEAYLGLLDLVASLTEDDLAQRVWYTESTPEARKRLECRVDSPPELLELWCRLIPDHRIQEE